MSGQWTGGSQNRQWTRGRKPGQAQDPARDKRLYSQMSGMAFWCEHCGGTHPLSEHATCRAEHSS